MIVINDEDVMYEPTDGGQDSSCVTIPIVLVRYIK